MNELEKLQVIASQFGYSSGIMQASIEYGFSILKKNLVPGPVLELGPAEGVMTRLLYEISDDISVVEGSTQFCERLKERYLTAKIYNSMFEDFEPKQKFSNIVLSHVLEHVADPVSLLQKIKSWMMPHGIVFAAVPNAHSIHRQAAVLMGLLKTENQLNASDINHGHRRVFNPEEFKKIFKDANFSVDKFGGYWLKPLSNNQIEANWSQEMINAYMELGERFPNIAGEIYLIASCDH